MSVPKSQRSVAVSQFIKDIIDVRKATIAIVDKFPKSYNRKTTNLLMDLAREAYEFAIKGNDIYLGPKTLESNYNLRSEFFARAHAALKALGVEITFCLALVNDGTNFLGKKSQYLPKFQGWSDLVAAALARLRGVMDSDKRRWKEWHP